MVRGVPLHGRLVLSVLIGALAIAWSPGAQASAASSGPTTAWRHGTFAVDVPGVVRRSDVVLGHPNALPEDSMPLGNGRLGAAVWAAGGFTAQLNRVDTFPDRKSPGQVVIPGLAALTGAPDYRGGVDLYDATLRESGGGLTASTTVLQDRDELVVDVRGADPHVRQTAQVRLWPGRQPVASARGAVAALAETFVDGSGLGASGATFGSLAAITAGGRDVSARVVDPLTIEVAFDPYRDGSFRVVVAAPRWTGGDAIGTAAALIGSDAGRDDSALRRAHLAWWHSFWARVGLVELSSADGSAQYVENLRHLDLYTAAASSGGNVPGSHAGVADLFNWDRDTQRWFPAGYWEWNLRMQVAANLGAGAPDLNAPYFALYRDNLANIEAWTAQRMGGRPGACVPETMRFNGNGAYRPPADASNASCDGGIPPMWNARNLTTGSEVSLWIWQQYLATRDARFLAANYPVMAAAARFLLAYAVRGSDGLLHTSPSNAHETQWDVADPTTDIAAMSALFPAVIQAAGLLGRDPGLVAQLRAAIPELLPLPRTDAATQTELLPPSADAGGADVIAISYQPAAAMHNVENIGLEPVWPYGLIGDEGGLSALARRTFADRPHPLTNDWSNDPIQAARLGLGADFQSSVVALTEKYQVYPSGMADLSGSRSGGQPYGEQAGVVATAVQEALVQDYDGLLRIAPAWPSGWDAAATVFVQGGDRVHVQLEAGRLVTVAIDAGSSGRLHVRNPWPGRRVQVIDGNGHRVLGPTPAARLDVGVSAGHSYLIEPADQPTTSLPFAPVTGSPATAARALGAARIGLP